MIDTCHYTFVKTYKIHNTTNDPLYIRGLELIMYQYWFSCNKGTTLRQDVPNRRGLCAFWERGENV